MADRSDQLFGQIAVDRGLIAPEALEDALAEQDRRESAGRPLPLGDLLLELGLLDADAVAAVLGEQEYVELREEDRKLGALAVRNRFATRAQVDAALGEQQADFERTGAAPARLGEYLVRAGVLTERRLESLVRAQERIRQAGARRSEAGLPAARAGAPAAGGARARGIPILAGAVFLAGCGIATWFGGVFAGGGSPAAGPGNDVAPFRANQPPRAPGNVPAPGGGENEAALAAWRAFAPRVETLRKAQQYREAIALIDGFSVKPGDGNEDRRGALRDAVLGDARRWLKKVIDQAHDRGKDGRPEEGIALMAPTRDRLPAELHLVVNATVEELRLEMVRLEEEKAAFAAGGPKKPPTGAGSPADAERAAKRTAASQARLDQVKKSLAERLTRHAEEDRLQAARVLEATTKAPIAIDITADFRLPRCRIARFSRDGVTVETSQVSMPMSWDALPPPVAYEIRRLAMDEASADAHLAMGKFCLLRELFDHADRHFKRAISLRADLAGRVPDTQVFRNRRKLFRGAWSQVGRDLLKLSYEFVHADELLDFETEAKAAAVKGLLEMSGQEFFSAGIRGLTFSDQVTLEVSGLQEAGALPLFGLLFQDQIGREAGFLAVVSPQQRQVQVMRVDEEKIAPVVAFDGVAGDTPVQIRLASLEIELRVGGTKLWSGAQPKFSECRVLIGGIAPSGSGTVRFQRLRVEGKAGAEWVRKSLSRNDTLAMRELEDDLKGLATAGATARTVALSVEDRLGDLPAQARESYVWAKTRIDAGDLADLPGILAAIGIAGAGAPDFPGTPFYAGRMLALLGALPEAIRVLDEAIRMEPSFAEAFGARASAWLDLRHPDDARKDAEQALRLAPDLAEAHHVLGRLQIEAGKREEALRTLELANALDPGDPAVRLLWKGIRNLLRGPLWKKAFRAETAHVVVQTDVSQARAAHYAQHLEAIMGYYAQTFGLPLPKRRVDALVFDTQEGYQTYAELTLEDRVESTLGYYHPVYDQLLLFEDHVEAAATETLRVLYHEGFHQFIHPVIPHLPYWLNEGLAEYFGASEVKDGKVVRTGLVQTGRLMGLQAYLREGGRPLGFAEIMKESPAEFYSGNVPLKYAQAWAMVHFFLEAGRERYRSVLMAYVESLRAGDGAEVAFEKTFGRADLRRAEQEWQMAVEAMKAE